MTTTPEDMRWRHRDGSACTHRFFCWRSASAPPGWYPDRDALLDALTVRVEAPVLFTTPRIRDLEKRTRPRPDYALIARMEREIYGEAFRHDGAPSLESLAQAQRDDEACLKMLAGAHYAPGSKLMLPSGRIITWQAPLCRRCGGHGVKARGMCATCKTAYGKSVYETHPEKLDEPIIITGDEARQAGFAEPPWSRLREWLPDRSTVTIWGVAAVAVLVLWALGVGR